MKQVAFMLVLVVLLCTGIGIYGSRAWEIYQRGVPVAETSELAIDESRETVVELRSAAFSPPAVDLDEILDNAVFEPARKRPQPAPVAEAEPEPEPVIEPVQEPRPLDVAILGIVLQGDTGFLVIRSDRGNRPEQITLGDTVDGWTLVQLSEMVAVFERDGEETRLNLALR